MGAHSCSQFYCEGCCDNARSSGMFCHIMDLPPVQVRQVSELQKHPQLHLSWVGGCCCCPGWMVWRLSWRRRLSWWGSLFWGWSLFLERGLRRLSHLKSGGPSPKTCPRSGWTGTLSAVAELEDRKTQNLLDYTHFTADVSFSLCRHLT